MDVEMLLYNKLDKYGNELTSITPSDLKEDIIELYKQLKALPGLDDVCNKLISFLPKKEFSKDDFADVIVNALHYVQN
ncbi:MAG: hypothetical protein JWN78_1533 [Bacteroidota bacterium]|nr:hypothetical protein [Bacteroidota bacterium]